MLLEKPTDEQIKELESYKVDDLMAKIIMMAYMEDDLIGLFEDYKTMKKRFDDIKARRDVNTIASATTIIFNSEK